MLQVQTLLVELSKNLVGNIMLGVIKRAFWDAPQGQIHYRYILTTATEKKAPVVFLHQSASCGWAYQSMMKQYADRGHDCYAPDMPGSVP
jgi:pimeloyl-ACP methyl ester carboxylesterase